MIKVNPSIVVREELEGWGVIFDPDTGDSFGLNALRPAKVKRIF